MALLISQEIGEIVSSKIRPIVLGNKEMVKFGKASLEQEKIYRSKDSFLYIKTRGMYGQKVRVELFEKDFMPPNESLLLGSKENVSISKNVAYVPIEMSGVHSKAKRLRNFEGWEYEIIARITPDNKSIKPFDSKVINLIIDAKKSDEEAKRSTVDGSMKCVIGSAEDEKQEEKNEDVKKCFCGKEHIDLRDKMTFSKQTGGANCKVHCDSIISILNVKSEGASGKSMSLPSGTTVSAAFYQLALENDDNTELIYDKSRISLGMEYLNLSLHKGYPVVVGITHTFRKDKTKNKDINEYTTDHFVIIVGRYCENNTIYYRFWDVGSSNGGINDYKFKLDISNHLSCDSDYNSKKIDVTQIRRNIDLTDSKLLDMQALKNK